MARYTFHHRIAARMPFNAAMVHNRPTLPALARFTELVWYGADDEGHCVYRRDPSSGEVVRIDFLPPREFT